MQYVTFCSRFCNFLCFCLSNCVLPDGNAYSTIDLELLILISCLPIVVL